MVDGSKCVRATEKCLKWRASLFTVVCCGTWVSLKRGGVHCVGNCFRHGVRLYTNPKPALSIHKYPIRMETCVYGELLIWRGQFFYTIMQGRTLLLWNPLPPIQWAVNGYIQSGDRLLRFWLSINTVNRKRVARFLVVFLCSPFFLINKLISSFDSIMTEQDDNKMANGS